MKALFITLCMLTITFGTLQASSPYLEAMQKNIKLLYEAQTPEEHQAVINTFERIAQAEQGEWHPTYYITLGYIMMSSRMESPADMDKYLDQATESLKKAMEIKPEESELVALEGFIHMIRTTVDPATRGQEYSALSMQALSKAVKMNPENPRALYLLAQMQLGIARFFGSDTSEGCATLSRAIELFDSVEPAHPLDPSWGKEGALAVRQQCE